LRKVDVIEEGEGVVDDGVPKKPLVAPRLKELYG
jgi:hypothetical protein